jgi:predicted dehydrogenase
MALDRVRLAVIGVGRHARMLSIPALEISGAYEIVALSTAHPESAAEVRALFGRPTSVGYAAILARDDVEAVLIAAPNRMHVEIATAALRAGKHVFCETPGVYSPEDVLAVGRAHAESGRVLAYCTHLRYSPIYRKVAELIPELRAGERVVLDIRFYNWVRHMYDLALHLLGDVVRVYCRQQANQVIATLEFASGDLGVVHSGGVGHVGVPLEHLEICGAGGLVWARDGHDVQVYRGLEPVAAHELALASTPSTTWAPTNSIPYRGIVHFTLRGYIPYLEWFARSVRTGEPTLSGLDQAERTLRLERAVARALAEGSVIEVEPPFQLR